MKRNTLLKLTLLMSTIVIIVSCNGPSGGSIKMHQLYYSRDSVRTLLNNPDFKKLVFQFYTSDISKNPRNWEGIAYAVGYDSTKCKMIYIEGKTPDTLKQVKDSLHTFSGHAIFGNLELYRSDLYAITHDQSGNELDYDSLYCQPMRARSNHIWYFVFAVKNGVRIPHTPTGGDYGPNFNPRPPED